MPDNAVLVLLLFIRGLHAAKVVCNGLIFHHVYYDREMLFSGLGRPYNLIMHKFSGLLYFSHTVSV
jgi:hypothetical protein